MERMNVMNRAYLAVAIPCFAILACAEPDDAAVDTTTHALQATPCDYITCGRNTKDIGNGVVDHVFFDGTANDRGQRFVGWETAGGAAITPMLTSRTLYGRINGQWRLGAALVGSVITLTDAEGPLYVRFADADHVALPNGVSAWTYRLDTRRPARPWRPLCSLFDHTTSEAARYALLGTREVVHVRARQVTDHAAAEGKLTLGCPSSATGKMLSLGALTTTAAADQLPTLDEMNATLMALTLSPTGDKSYTEPGVGVMFFVARTGVDNHGESWSGGLEGAWDRHGAICFDRLRGVDYDHRWALWSDTHVPSCSDVDLSDYDVLVRTHRFFGIYPAYPPPPPPLPITL